MIRFFNKNIGTKFKQLKIKLGINALGAINGLVARL